MDETAPFLGYLGIKKDCRAGGAMEQTPQARCNLRAATGNMDSVRCASAGSGKRLTRLWVWLNYPHKSPDTFRQYTRAGASGKDSAQGRGRRQGPERYAAWGRPLDHCQIVPHFPVRLGRSTGPVITLP